MASVSVNSLPVTEGKITFPLFGAWVADLIVTSGGTVSGAVSITMDGDNPLTLSGTVYRGAEFIQDNRLRVVGGKAGLFKDAKPKHYKDFVLMRNVLGDLMSDSGESLSSTSDTSLLSSQMDMWTTTKQPVSRVILSLLEMMAPDSVFRVRPDGSVFVGADSFSNVDSSFPDAVVLDRDDVNGKLVVGLDLPNLLPGVTFQEKKISYVEHHFDSMGVRANAWFVP